MVPCFSVPPNVIRALKDAYGLDSNPHRSLVRLRHRSLSLTRLVSAASLSLSFSSIFSSGRRLVLIYFPWLQ